ASSHGDDGFGQGRAEAWRVGVGRLDVLEQLNFELLNRAHLHVALLAHGHSSHQLPLEGAELGRPQRAYSFSSHRPPAAATTWSSAASLSRFARTFRAAIGARPDGTSV